MKVLISPTSIEEARIVVNSGVDILDIKNTKEGSLGAQPPWVLQSIFAEFAGRNIVCSVALGDLPNKPGTIALATYGATQCGAGYFKAGMYGATNYEELLPMADAFVKAVRMGGKAGSLAVVCGYADYRRFGGVSPVDIVKAAAATKADLAMLDTAIKDGKDLFDALSMEELNEFVALAHQHGLKVALAGSVKASHLSALQSIQTDIVGVRGACCDGSDRTKGITAEAVADFIKQVRTISNAA